MVGSDVWIGREIVIMPGVSIGDVAIVAAYSVVAKDIPPYSVAGGNPARVVKKRFEDDELIEMLLRLRWWDLPGEELAEMIPLLCSPELEAVKEAVRGMLERA